MIPFPCPLRTHQHEGQKLPWTPSSLLCLYPWSHNPRASVSYFFTCLSQFLSPLTGLAASALGLAEPWGTVSCPGWSWSDVNPVFFLAVELPAWGAVCSLPQGLSPRQTSRDYGHTVCQPCMGAVYTCVGAMCCMGA